MELKIGNAVRVKSEARAFPNLKYYAGKLGVVIGGVAGGIVRIHITHSAPTGWSQEPYIPIEFLELVEATKDGWTTIPSPPIPKLKVGDTVTIKSTGDGMRDSLWAGETGTIKMLHPGVSARVSLFDYSPAKEVDIDTTLLEKVGLDLEISEEDEVQKDAVDFKATLDEMLAKRGYKQSTKDAWRVVWHQSGTEGHMILEIIFPDSSTIRMLVRPEEVVIPVGHQDAKALEYLTVIKGNPVRAKNRLLRALWQSKGHFTWGIDGNGTYLPTIDASTIKVRFPIRDDPYQPAIEAMFNRWMREDDPIADGKEVEPGSLLYWTCTKEAKS